MALPAACRVPRSRRPAPMGVLQCGVGLGASVSPPRGVLHCVGHERCTRSRQTSLKEVCAMSAAPTSPWSPKPASRSSSVTPSSDSCTYRGTVSGLRPSRAHAVSSARLTAGHGSSGATIERTADRASVRRCSSQYSSQNVCRSSDSTPCQRRRRVFSTAARSRAELVGLLAGGPRAQVGDQRWGAAQQDERGAERQGADHLGRHDRHAAYGALQGPGAVVADGDGVGASRRVRRSARRGLGGPGPRRCRRG